MNGSAARRILLVAPSPPPYGGMALQARQLEKLLLRDGNAVRFFASNFQLPGLLRLPGIRTIARTTLIWFLLWRQARKVEVVHVLAASWMYFFLVAWPAVLVGRASGRRVVLNYRGGEADPFFRQYGWAVGPAFHLAHVVTAPSNFLAEVILKHFGVAVKIVPNILDTQIFRYRQRAAFRPKMLVTRHLEEIYDIESVLRAFGAVQRNHPEASLWIAGTGSQEARLRGLVAEWKLSKVRFLGHIPHGQLPAIFEQCDILLNASRVDNFPGALVEASAAGLVVVSTGAGGIPFIYQNELNALLVTPGDWSGLAAAVERVLESPALGSHLTKAAAGVAARCDWHQVRLALYEAYGFSKQSEPASELSAVKDACVSAIGANGEGTPMRCWLTWNVLFPLHERLKGHDTFPILREMEDADRLTPDELAALQRRKLKDLMGYCYTHVPFIRTRMQQAGLDPQNIQGPEDLLRLPVMTKSDVQKNRAALKSDAAGPLASFSSGGSTGSPLIFDIAKRRVASRVACRQRVNRWWGVSTGDSEIAIWGSPIELTRQDRFRKLRDSAFDTELLSAYEMNEETMSRYLDILEKRRPRQIFAYPSAMYVLSRHARKQGRNLRRLGVKVIFVTSEVLYPHQRELITETFNCPLANGYGGRDSGFISHECPQGGMHLMADVVIPEILNAEGKPAAPGEAGEIVVTDLYSHEAPFIRYATGDIGVLSTRLCNCGRSLPLLERLDGRSNDSVVAPDGRVMHGQALISILMEIPGIEHFRICQKRTDSFHVQLVKNEAYRQESEEHIRQKWSQRLRAPLTVTFEYLGSIPPERSGKVRHIVSELTAGNNLRKAEAELVQS